MRLTYDKNGTEPKIYDCDFLDNSKCIQKLGQLEDIEEELGIDLIKLLSAKKVYYMNWDMHSKLVIKETYKLFINLSDRTIEFYENEYSEFTFDLKLENYGRNDVWCGWALTREELKK